MNHVWNQSIKESNWMNVLAICWPMRQFRKIWKEIQWDLIHMPWVFFSTPKTLKESWNIRKNPIKSNGNVWDSQTLATYWTISNVNCARTWSTQLMKNRNQKDKQRSPNNSIRLAQFTSIYTLIIWFKSTLKSTLKYTTK